MPSNAVDCRARDWGIESRHARSSRPVVTMTNSPPPGLPSSDVVSDRLDSWKEIAAYLKRDVTTVQRWEKREGMPVRRHLHDKLGSVYAFRPELDEWTRSRDALAARETTELEPAPAKPRKRSRNLLWSSMAAGLLLVIAAAWWLFERRGYFWRNPL